VIWGCHGHRKCQCLIEYIRFLRRFRKMRRSCTVCEQFVESHKVLLLHVFGDMHVFDTYLICICVELLYLNEFEFGLTSMRHRVVSVPNYHILYPKTRHATFGHNFSSKHTPISEILTVKSPPQKKTVFMSVAETSALPELRCYTALCVTLSTHPFWAIYHL